MFAEIDIIEYSNWFDKRLIQKQECNVNIYLKEVGTCRLLKEPGSDITKIYIMITEGMSVKYIFESLEKDSMIVSFDNLRIRG